MFKSKLIRKYEDTVSNVLAAYKEARKLKVIDAQLLSSGCMEMYEFDLNEFNRFNAVHEALCMENEFYSVLPKREMKKYEVSHNNLWKLERNFI